ncbi:MAG: hypothetical protein ACFB0B_19610 [Thermonemataceae bacterium]
MYRCKNIYLWFVVCFLTTIFFVACRNESNVGLPDEPFFSANAGNDTTITIGQTYTLNGEVVSDSVNLSYDYEWVMISQPSSSSITLTGANSKRASFIPQVAGEYFLRLTISFEEIIDEDEIVIMVR